MTEDDAIGRRQLGIFHNYPCTIPTLYCGIRQKYFRLFRSKNLYTTMMANKRIRNSHLTTCHVNSFIGSTLNFTTQNREHALSKRRELRHLIVLYFRFDECTRGIFGNNSSRRTRKDLGFCNREFALFVTGNLVSFLVFKL